MTHTDKFIRGAGLAALLAAALPAVRADVRSDGLPNGNRVVFDRQNGGGGASAGNGFRAAGSLGAVSTPKSSSTNNAYNVVPGAPSSFFAGILGSPIGNPFNRPPSLEGDIRSFPVPYRPSLHPNGIQFTGMPAGPGAVRIFTLDGDLVRLLRYEDGAVPVVWNPVENSQGDLVASNAYIFVVESNGRKKIGQLLVVR